MIKIKQMTLYRLRMPLRTPFSNWREQVKEKDLYICELVDQDGVTGYGESVAFDSPWYTEETTETVHYIAKTYLKQLLKEPFSHPSEFIERANVIKRNHMAKAMVEGALWDIFAKRLEMPLYQVLGGKNPKVNVGVAIGMKQTDDETLDAIGQAEKDGYKRIKLKVSKKNDLRLIEKIRAKFPMMPLMIDANGAYTIQDIEHVKKFDHYNLLMIEQPFHPEDFVDHKYLQEQLHTPVCLDESIHTIQDVRTAIALESCRIISVKLGRVGGFRNALTIHDLCQKHQIGLWTGGMLEAGIGRAQSLALATLPGFTYPADQAGADRYWEKDILSEEIMAKNGMITLPERPGIGYEVDKAAIAYYQIDREIVKV
jgi:o-succinylbenzoate synthase